MARLGVWFVVVVRHWHGHGHDGRRGHQLMVMGAGEVAVGRGKEGPVWESRKGEERREARRRCRSRQGRRSCH
jgi:hypothetical protein